MRAAKAFQQMKVLKSYLTKTEFCKNECMVDCSVDNKRLNQFAIFHILCNRQKYVWVLTVSKRYDAWVFYYAMWNCTWNGYIYFASFMWYFHTKLWIDSNTMDLITIVLGNILAMILANFIHAWIHIVKTRSCMKKY